MAKKPVLKDAKIVPCTYCSEPIQVSKSAMSIFCPHCHKRVVCEDYTIKSYHAVRLFATCGDIVIEKKGHVVAPIMANSLIVRGLVKGNVKVQDVVEIEPGATIQGDVEGPRMILHDGAKLIGACRIVRRPVTKQPLPAVESADEPPPPPKQPAAGSASAPKPKPELKLKPSAAPGNASPGTPPPISTDAAAAR